MTARRLAILRWAPLALVALVLILGYTFGLHQHISRDAFCEYRENLGNFVEEDAARAAVGYLLIYVAAVAVSFPGASALTIAGGFMFGAIAGTILAVVAATIGATLIFLIARTSIGDVLTKRAGPRIQLLRKGFQEEGFSYLLFLRLVPIFFFWLVNLAAAVFGMRLIPYVAATAIGIVPATFVYAYFGESLGTALDCVGSPLSLKLFLALALLGVLAVIPILVRKWRRSRQKEPGASS